MSTLLEQYDQARAEFDARVSQVGDGQWSAGTPCREWDVRALVGHLVDEARWVPYLLGGGTPADAGDRFDGDPLGADPVAAWHDQSAAATAALHAEGALDRAVVLSRGETSARDYLWELTCDLAVHAWDLARAIGADERLDPELVRRIYQELDKDPAPLGSTPGLFDPPVAVPGHSDLQTQLLGLYGRRV